MTVSRSLELLLVVLVWLFCTASAIDAATDAQPATPATVSAEQSSPSATARPAEKHGLPQSAVELARPLGLPITNSMIVTWIVAVGLIVFAQMATRRMKEIPEGAQNFWEWLVESLHNFLEGIIGPRLVRRTFWFFATIFIFILFTNRVGLIPGVGTIGWGHHSDHGFKVDHPLFRGANADLNLTLAMALVFFVCWVVWALQEIGPVGFAKELFAPKGDSIRLLKVLMIFICFCGRPKRPGTRTTARSIASTWRLAKTIQRRPRHLGFRGSRRDALHHRRLLSGLRFRRQSVHGPFRRRGDGRVVHG